VAMDSGWGSDEPFVADPNTGMPVAGGADGNKGKHYIFCKSYFSVRCSIFAVRTKSGE
jgi:hypothetical protein